MENIWIFKSHNLHMFVLARDYAEARERFKSLLDYHITKQTAPVLDEVIEITKPKADGKFDDTDSHIEFTENWLKELGVPVDIINF